MTQTIDMLLTAEEVAEIFKCTKRTLYNWRSKMGMPYMKISRTKLYYEFTEVWKWARDNREYIQHDNVFNVFQKMAQEIELSEKG